MVHSRRLLQFGASLLLASQQVTAITTSDAENAYSQLQSWYNSGTGTWMPSTGWWNSANCLTVVANLAKISGTVSSSASGLWSDVLTKAPQTNMGLEKRYDHNFLPRSTYYAPRRHRRQYQRSGFLNNYYDDEGWWAHAWIAVYDVTGDSQYLDTASSIFEDMHAAEGTTPCGGIWWDKSHTYVNAIANELYLSLAAHLANRAGNKQYYLDIATNQWNWFQNAGFINGGNTINDGLNANCQNNGGIVWSYNQGVILGGLVELSRATGDGSYTSRAKEIADAAIAALAPNGILHDSCEPNCGADGSQFKGVFARNLMLLQQNAGEDRYRSFLQANADSIWSTDRDGNQLSVVWSGPFVAPANASTQSSAMDAIVGALSV